MKPLTRRSFLAAGGAAALVAGLAACAGGNGPTPTAGAGSSPPTPAPELDDATRSMLDRLFQAGFAATGVTGLAGVMRIGDDVWTGSAGVADLSIGAPFRPDDFMRIASITKTFTGTAVLQLVDEKRLRLDDPIERFVAGVPNGTTATVEDLLGMRSGIPDFTSDPQFLQEFTANPTMPWSNEQTLEVIRRHPPDFAPGEKVAYCDSNYALLGMVLEAVTESSAAEVITSRIIEPLGLTSTSYPTTATLPDPHPNGYVPVVVEGSDGFDNTAYPPTVVNEVNPAVPSTAGAIISTLDDLRTWGDELVTGTLLSPETQALRLRTHRFDSAPLNVGYGLGIMSLNEFLGHNGAIFGFSSVVFTRPQTGTQVALVANESTNSTRPTFTVALELIKALYPDQAV